MAQAAYRRVNSRSEYAKEAAYARTPVRVRRQRNTKAAALRGNTRARAGAGSRARALSRAFVFFLVVMSCATVFLCVRYLGMKSVIMEQNREVSAMRTELQKRRAENDALYADIENMVDMDLIREKAMEEYGMKYASQDQIIWYNTKDNGYVRQFREVPSD